jgi:ATP-dependent helicase/nuclease subunit B
LIERKRPVQLVEAFAQVHADPALRLSPAEDQLTIKAGLAAAQARLAPRLARLAATCGIERARWRFFSGQRPAHAFVGAVGEAVGGELPGLTAGKPISASDLDSLGNCGFRFLAQRLLGVGEADEPGAAPEPRDLGTVAHRALELFWRQRIAGGAHKAVDLETRAELEQALDQALREYDAKDPAGHPTLWAIERARLVDRLWRLTELDMAAASTPAEVELGFGMQGRDGPPRFAAVELGGLWIGGRLDRVDRMPGGGVMVLDYKTGILKTQEDKVKPGHAGVSELQLPIYVHAARQLLATPDADGRLISLANVAATRSLGATHADLGGVSALLDDTLTRRVSELGEQLRSGQLTVAPRDCAYCPVRTACRVVHLELDEDEETP